MAIADLVNALFLLLCKVEKPPFSMIMSSMSQVPLKQTFNPNSQLIGCKAQCKEPLIVFRTVQILEDQILARPIFYFLQHPEASDLKKD